MGARHLGTYDQAVTNATYFIRSDWQGSERQRIRSDGIPYQTCANLPFGDGLGCSAADPSPMHLTGKQRDTETGLDYFGARYLSSGMGRWMSPDWASKPASVPYAQFGDPQSLNLYGYVANNPVSRQDSDGHLVNIRNQYGSSGMGPVNTFFGSGDNPYDQQGFLQNTQKDTRNIIAEAQNQRRIFKLTSTTFSSLNAVGIAATRVALYLVKESVQLHNDYGTAVHEYGGLIGSNHTDGFRATAPIEGGPNTHMVEGMDALAPPSGTTTVGEYHAHPHVDVSEGEGPSWQDVERAHDLNRAGFVSDSITEHIYRYGPQSPISDGSGTCLNCTN